LRSDGFGWRAPAAISLKRRKTSISAKDGFAGHIHAWRDNEIDYFAHQVAGE